MILLFSMWVKIYHFYTENPQIFLFVCFCGVIFFIFCFLCVCFILFFASNPNSLYSFRQQSCWFCGQHHPLKLPFLPGRAKQGVNAPGKVTCSYLLVYQFFKNKCFNLFFLLWANFLNPEMIVLDNFDLSYIKESLASSCDYYQDSLIFWSILKVRTRSLILLESTGNHYSKFRSETTYLPQGR